MYRIDERKKRLLEENLQRIGDIFNNIHKDNMIGKPQIYSLIDEYIKDQTNFINGVEQCFLKIIKSGVHGQKKSLEKYEKLTEKLFQTMYSEASNPRERPNKIDLDQVYEEEVLTKLVEGTITLLQSKQTSLKLLALKIATYIQRFNIEELKIEMIKCMSSEENRDVRKVSIINLSVDEQTLPHILSRTREVDSELKLLVYRKLIKDQIHLANLQLADIYKLVYDGLYSREEGVKQQCIAYLRAVYNIFKEEQIANKPDNTSEISESNPRVLPKRKDQYQLTRIEIRRFLEIFQLSKCLKHPFIYDLMEYTMQTLVANIIDTNHLAYFLKEFTRLECKQGKFNLIKPEEIFFFRVTCQHFQQNLREYASLYSIIEDNFPSLAEYSKILEKAIDHKDLFSVYQMLLIAELMINADELGRQCLALALKSFCINIDIEPKLDLDTQIDEEDEIFNDIYMKKTQEDLLIENYSCSFFDTPIIKDSNDLIPIIVRILRNILDDKNNAFSNFILEIIAEIKEPVEKSLDGDRNDLVSQIEDINQNIENLENEIKSNADNIAKLKANIDITNKLIPTSITTTTIITAPNTTNINSNNEYNNINASNDELIKLEKYQEKLNKDLENHKSKINDINDKIEKIIMRCLQIACSLLQTCKFSLSDPGIMGLLSQFIGPCFQHHTPKIRDLAFLCLSIYVLLDKKFCVDYMKVYKEILDRGSTESLPVLLTTIKAIFDFFLYHDLAKQDNLTFESNDDTIFDCNDLLQKIINLMFISIDQSIKKVCVEGFTRLIFNQKEKNSIIHLCLLMIIWINNLKNGTAEIIQILTMFFRAYVKYSRKGLDDFEKALEIYLILLIELLDSNELDFNTDYIIQGLNEELNSTICRMCIELMTSALKKFNEEDIDNNNNDNDSSIVNPIERFLIFLIKSSASENKYNKSYKGIIERCISYFNIEGFSNKKKKLISMYNDPLFDNVKNNVEFQDNENMIYSELKQKLNHDLAIDQIELIDMIKDIDEGLNFNKEEGNILIDLLKKHEIVINPKTRPPKNPVETGNSNDQVDDENSQNKKISLRKKDNKVDYQDNEQPDMDGIITEENQKKKKRGRKKKSDIENSGDDEDSSFTVEDEIPSVKRKLKKQNVSINDNETVDNQDPAVNKAVEVEKATVPRKRGRKPKKRESIVEENKDSIIQENKKGIVQENKENDMQTNKEPIVQETKMHENKNPYELDLDKLRKEHLEKILSKENPEASKKRRGRKKKVVNEGQTFDREAYLDDNFQEKVNQEKSKPEVSKKKRGRKPKNPSLAENRVQEFLDEKIASLNADQNSVTPNNNDTSKCGMILEGDKEEEVLPEPHLIEDEKVSEANLILKRVHKEPEIITQKFTKKKILDEEREVNKEKEFDAESTFKDKESIMDVDHFLENTIEVNQSMQDIIEDKKLMQDEIESNKDPVKFNAKSIGSDYEKSLASDYGKSVVSDFGQDEKLSRGIETSLRVLETPIRIVDSNPMILEVFKCDKKNTDVDMVNEVYNQRPMINNERIYNPRQSDTIISEKPPQIMRINGESIINQEKMRKIHHGRRFDLPKSKPFKNDYFVMQRENDEDLQEDEGEEEEEEDINESVGQYPGGYLEHMQKYNHKQPYHNKYSIQNRYPTPLPKYDYQQNQFKIKKNHHEMMMSMETESHLDGIKNLIEEEVIDIQKKLKRRDMPYMDIFKKSSSSNRLYIRNKYDGVYAEDNARNKEVKEKAKLYRVNHEKKHKKPHRMDFNIKNKHLTEDIESEIESTNEVNAHVDLRKFNKKANTKSFLLSDPSIKKTNFNYTNDADYSESNEEDEEEEEKVKRPTHIIKTHNIGGRIPGVPNHDLKHKIPHGYHHNANHKPLRYTLKRNQIPINELERADLQANQNREYMPNGSHPKTLQYSIKSIKPMKPVNPRLLHPPIKRKHSSSNEAYIANKYLRPTYHQNSLDPNTDSHNKQDPSEGFPRFRYKKFKRCR